MKLWKQTEGFIRITAAAIALIAALSITSCEQPAGNSSSPMPTVTSVTVSPATATVAKGGTQTFSATVTGTDNPAQTVTWSIVETNKKPGTTITGAGKLTVAADETLAVLTVKATSTADAAKSGTAAVTVTEPLLTLNGNVSISPSGTVNINTPLTASYTGSEAVSYQWEEDGTAIPGATSNTYTPTSGGIYAVTVSATGYHSKTSNAVTVNDPSLLTLSGDVSISPSGTVAINTPLTASYSGSETVGYQWEKDGIAIDGETSNTYTPTEAGDYTVIVRAEGYNPQTSGAVTVLTQPIITVHYDNAELPPNGTINAGEAFVFQPKNITVTIKNEGTETLTIDTASIAITGTDAAAFTRLTNPGTNIPAGGQSSFMIECKPVKEGVNQAALSIPNNDTTHNPAVFSLNVTGKEALFLDIASLAEYLDTLSDNTADTPYTVKLNVATLPNGYNNAFVTSINGAGKYVNLDLFGSTFASIGDWAFGSCTSLTSITIPNGVTFIGNTAFADCSSLASITIPDSVTSIGNQTFANCSSLASITIPDSVTSIGDYAFSGCRSLTSITIPDSVASIGRNAFYGCSSLASITVSNGNPNYTSENGLLFDKAKTTLIQYTTGKTDASYTIPNDVTSIGDYAFAICHSLTSITIPDSVTSIGGYAFSRCSSLASINIPDSVTTIRESAFYGCTSLESITIPDSVTTIESMAFANCTSLASVTFGGIIAEADFSDNSFPGDLRAKYLAGGGGIGIYTRLSESDIWTKQ